MIYNIQKHTILKIALLTILISIALISTNKELPSLSPKINGVSFVAPPQFISQEAITPIKKINSNWVAIIPYAFSIANEPNVYHSNDQQWWGERYEGAQQTIEYAHNIGLKVMLKPHVWVRGQGWAGDYSLSSQSEWNKWYQDYSDYILTYAKLAETMNVELFCIGTEYRKAATVQPDLWIDLIKKVRENYTGELTYAANWDNYQEITFWGKLDYIGIDAYFPISDQKTPSVEELVKNWIPIKNTIKSFSDQYNKPVLFTEYGYESRDYSGDGDWNYSKDTLEINLQGQTNAYQAMYQSYWDEDWFAGGFLWKWHADHDKAGGTDNKRFTPQNKPVELIIREHNETFNQ